MTSTALRPFESPDMLRFREALRTWFAEHVPAGWGTSTYVPPTDEPAEIAILRTWQRTLFDGGWAGLSWPRKYGGAGRSLLEQAIFVEERDRIKAPLDVGIVGTQMVGPMLIQHGSDHQKERYLRRILTGDDLWCQGFSEPVAGSDLAGLRTRATFINGRWHLSGQKVWTSRAQYADQMILLARNDPDAPTHHGITSFIVPMSAAGLTIRPLRQINGATEFCEVFLDDVTLGPEMIVGEVGAGWRIALSTLSFERFATTRAFEMRHLAADLVTAVDAAGLDDTEVLDALTKHVIEAHAACVGYQRMVAGIAARGQVGVEASVGKLVTTELGQRIVGTAMIALPVAVTLAPVEPWYGGPPSWPLEYVNGLKNTIAAGTSQIQRNIIGERVLGLPREGGKA